MVNNNILSQSTPTVKPVAIYCRVSTEDQEREGTSLETQRQACLKYCQDHGYQPVYQLSETASGLTLDRPELMKLRELVRTQQIQTIVIYCLDRFSRKAEHGVILTMELEKYGVTLEAVTEDIDTSELGKLISYIRGYAASLEAEKLKERTTRGIRARVYDKGLPVTYRAPYGYQWDRENTRLVPDNNYENIKLILDLSVEGKTYDYIVNELRKRGIPSPAGLPEWNKHTISRLIHEPVYIGQYYAFRSQAVVPEKRNGTMYGKTSMKRLPESEWHLIPEIEVVDPPITADQRALLLERLDKRQKLSKRHATRDYLFRGMILCQTHKGKKGEPRRYHGQPHYDTWRYVCPVGGCDTPYLDGPVIEEYFKSLIALVFASTPDEFYKKITEEGMKGKSRKDIEAEIKKLETENSKLFENMVTLEDRFIKGEINTDVRNTLKSRYQGKQIINQDRQDSLLEQLATLDRDMEAVESYKQLQKRFSLRMGRSMEKTPFDTLPADSDEFNQLLDKLIATVDEETTPEQKDYIHNFLLYEKYQVDKARQEEQQYEPLTIDEWREILTALDFNISIYPQNTEGKTSARFGLGGKMVCWDMSMSLPVESNVQLMQAIAEHSAGNVLHNRPSRYPIRFDITGFLENIVEPERVSKSLSGSISKTRHNPGEGSALT